MELKSPSDRKSQRPIPCFNRTLNGIEIVVGAFNLYRGIESFNRTLNGIEIIMEGLQVRPLPLVLIVP